MRRMRRPERREQILDAATTAFARSGGFTATSLDDIAAEAGVTRMILYRHFASKTELYQAVIDRAAERLHAAATARGGLSEETVPAMMDWAAAEPDAFRLLFHHAVREPEFRGDIDQLRAGMARTLRPHLAAEADSEAWADWAAGLATTVAIEAIMAWLDAGQPDLEKARRRVLRAIDGVYQALTVH
ncbi:DNA-binding transcriptional regulator, AcrR family [Amycolatopsis arida]|uniref:DNA-binding transcriptional regulator, AcrR family n=1 Tax=Amycolatopsis arida TaxID=587909 RepID=A0A1I5SN34_9PSEU|nr:AcrR family transcriptional regulator [Amycolatopsis arida]SFP72061.1 DNA-binding transcriptional regulator, AcrR family [Amycolatopsis arida]